MSELRVVLKRVPPDWCLTIENPTHVFPVQTMRYPDEVSKDYLRQRGTELAKLLNLEFVDKTKEAQ